MVKIALVQFSPLNPTDSPSLDSFSSESNFDVNLRRAHSFVRDAAGKGAELIIFPEYFLSGVVSDPAHWHLSQFPSSHAHLHAEDPDEASPAPHSVSVHFLTTFQDLAKELKVDIAVGTIVERAVDENGQERTKEVDGEKRLVLENVAHYVGWNGEIIGRYVKKNLWWPEKDYLTAGSADHQVFDTRFGRVGFLICWDLASPLSLPSLLLHPSGPPDLIIAPTYWVATDAGDVGLSHNKDSEEEYLRALVKTRAWEGECAMVFCNVASPPGAPKDVGPENEEGRIGCSQVCVPFKGTIGAAKTHEEEVVVVDVDLGVLKDARSVYGVSRDLQRQLGDKEGRKEVLPGWVRKE